jgi:integrase
LGHEQKEHGVSAGGQTKLYHRQITIYSPWEVTQFLRFARTELVPFVAIGAVAGLRTAELGRLDWSEVHLKERFVEIKASRRTSGQAFSFTSGAGG